MRSLGIQKSWLRISTVLLLIVFLLSQMPLTALASEGDMNNSESEVIEEDELIMDTEIPSDNIDGEDTSAEDTIDEADIEQDLDTEEIESVEEEVETEIEEPVEEAVLEHQPQMTTFTSKVNGKSYYVVQPDDTFEKIVTKFKNISDQNKNDRIYLYPTVEELKSWNNLKTESDLRKTQIISVDGVNNYSNYKKESINFNSNVNAMIDYFDDFAIKVGKDYGLYPSVIISQALHETGIGTSKKALLGNNYFGIKGSYKGHSIYDVTWEEDSKGNISYITDQFRLYPTIEESIISYADRIRNGPDTDSEEPSWNPIHYARAWGERTDSYLESIQGLKDSGYATDSRYVSKVDAYVLRYGLTKYDNDLILSKTPELMKSVDKVAYRGHISRNYPIFSTYGYQKGYSLNDYTASYMGTEIVVHQEAISNNNKWLLISANGKQLGWVTSKAIDPAYVQITKKAEVIFRAKVINGSSDIYSTPAWTEGNRHVHQTSKHVGKTVEVIGTALTASGTYANIAVDGNILGWIHMASLNPIYSNIIKHDHVTYFGKITSTANSIYSKPAWSEGNQLVGTGSEYLNKVVSIKDEATTKTGKYALVSIDGKELGWINLASIEKYTYQVNETRTVAYHAVINGDGNNIYSQPAWTKDSQLAHLSKNYKDQSIVVTKEKVTDLGVYSLVTVNGKNLGWINKGGLRVSYSPIHERRNVAYHATILGDGNNIYSTPAWSQDNKLVVESKLYANESIVVNQEIVTELGVYSLVSVEGKELGWINKAGLSTQYEPILTSNKVAYHAVIRGDGNNIYSTPAWTLDNRLVALSNDYKGLVAVVTEEKETKLGTFSLVSLNGKELGWINKAGITVQYTPVRQRRTVAYHAIILGDGNNIYTEPSWTEGNQLNVLSKNFKGQSIIVTEEKITDQGVYSLVTLHGKKLGWINKVGLGVKYSPILNSNIVAYRATIKGDGNNIYSTPSWTENNELVALSRDFTGKEIVVTQEQETSLGIYSLVVVDGKQIGWINKAGLNLDYAPILAERTVAYNAIIIGDGNNIYSEPSWTKDNTLAAISKDYANQNIVVTAEKVTSLGVYSLVTINGEKIGWINKAGLSPNYDSIISTKNVNYLAKITNANSNIYTIPAWTEGNEFAHYTSKYLNKKVTVTREIVTSGGVFALISIDKEELGWINAVSLKEYTPTVFIDVGHGGSDSGAHYFQVNEKDINLQVSKKLQKDLENAGFVVIMSRTDDTYMDYRTERSKMANGTNADIFISVHHNAMPNNNTVHGIETFYYQYDPKWPSKINEAFHNDPERIKESADLAYSIHKELITQTKAYDRTVKRETFAVLRETKIPAVLLELGFMSNKAELNKLVTDSYQTQLSRAVADGVINYFNNK